MPGGWFNQARRALSPFRGSRADSSLDRMVADPPAEGGTQAAERWAAVELTTKLARSLLGYGLPIYRLETALQRLADALGFEGSFYLTPTGMIATFTFDGQQETRVLSTVPGTVDMERLAALHALVGRVERGELSPSDASQRIDAILARPDRYGPVATVLAVGLLSASVARLLGSNLAELLVSGALGLGVGLVGQAARRSLTLGRLLPTVAALMAAFIAAALAATGTWIRPPVVLIAAVISLVPGLTLTIGMIELATANLVSGTARLAGAMVTFLQLGFGAALGHGLARLVDLGRWQAVQGLPEWTQVFAPVVATVAFVVLLRVRNRDAGWVLLTCSLAVLTSRVGGRAFEPEVGAFVGATLVGLVSHAYARRTDRPSLVPLVPGLLMLVPGTIGFLSMSSFLEDDPTAALQTGFDVFLIAMAVTAGVLVATIAVPLERSL